MDENEDDRKDEGLSRIGSNQVEEVKSEDGIPTFRMKNDTKNEINELRKRSDVVWGDCDSPNKQLKKKGFKCV